VLNTPEDSDPMTWHRYFAVQANNACWDLSTKKDRLAVDDQRMLDAAHTAFFHWAACGTEQNVQRARMLLAEVHTLVRLGDSALRYAREMHEYFLNTETSDWEIAFAHCVLAHAAHVAGDVTTYRDSFDNAALALEAIADAEDKKIVRATFDLIPQP
jgi:hypothetical protein